jgi:hypothetical protein
MNRRSFFQSAFASGLLAATPALPAIAHAELPKDVWIRYWQLYQNLEKDCWQWIVEFKVDDGEYKIVRGFSDEPCITIRPYFTFTTNVERKFFALQSLSDATVTITVG